MLDKEWRFDYTVQKFARNFMYFYWKLLCISWFIQFDYTIQKINKYINKLYINLINQCDVKLIKKS